MRWSSHKPICGYDYQATPMQFIWLLQGRVGRPRGSSNWRFSSSDTGHACLVTGIRIVEVTQDGQCIMFTCRSVGWFGKKFKASGRWDLHSPVITIVFSR